jgi:hypothetical protein
VCVDSAFDYVIRQVRSGGKCDETLVLSGKARAESGQGSVDCALSRPSIAVPSELLCVLAMYFPMLRGRINEPVTFLWMNKETGVFCKRSFIEVGIRGVRCSLYERASESTLGSRRVTMTRFLTEVLLLIAACIAGLAQSEQPALLKSREQIKHLKNFSVIEFRRYTIKEGERAHFAQYFESYFPEAFEQLGAIAFGSFFERKNPSGFTWFRGFHSLDDRAVVNGTFYYGPLWKEHKSKLNDIVIDSENVLLLEPLSPERGITVLPAVDPVTEPNGAQGVIIAQIFAVKANSVGAFAQMAEELFANYRAAGALEAGLLVTLDVKNNFPQLPIRTDGPYLVWLGVVKDNQVLERQFSPLVERSLRSLIDTGLLRGAPELVILDPTRRSRLRWHPQEQ